MACRAGISRFGMFKGKKDKGEGLEGVSKSVYHFSLFYRFDHECFSISGVSSLYL